MNSKHTIMISPAANGYILTLLDEDGETLGTAVAGNTDLRGYSKHCLITAIETLQDSVNPVVPSNPAAELLSIAIKEARESEL